MSRPRWSDENECLVFESIAEFFPYGHMFEVVDSWTKKLIYRGVHSAEVDIEDIFEQFVLDAEVVSITAHGMVLRIEVIAGKDMVYTGGGVKIDIKNH